ncbi:hypothetical protein [Aeoliella sp.]|uniref:hypothetical protein n=1 Tax=Aeoliella sp. TaxID=2795800 RepID=UPI003CCC32E4
MKLQFSNPTQRKVARRERRGMALMLCLFVVFMVSSLVLSMLNTETIQYAAARNVQDYERALYLANAGIHHVCAELEADTSWRGTVTDGLYPADDTYQATASDGTGGNVDIVSIGVAGDVTRTLEATVEL